MVTLHSFQFSSNLVFNMSSEISDTDRGSWDRFIKLCVQIGGISSRLSKTSLIAKFTQHQFKGDLKVFLKLILPKVTQRRYQMHRKRMLKLFASIFNEDVAVLDDLMTNGDRAGLLGEVISHSYKESVSTFPQRNNKTVLSMKEVDDFLDCLTKETRESQQEILLKNIVKRSNVNDLKWIVREIDRDLKINAGTKAVLDGIDDKAYAAFQTKASLDYIVNKMALGHSLTVSADLMTPLKPMLATACKNWAMAFNKCKSGLIYAEIKYDGERVQLHYDGKDWKFYSRSLKPVQAYKIRDIEEHVKASCPNAKTLILDSEILMIDTKTQKPLPFTSLGKHKRQTFADASPCLFVFDILFFNGKSLVKTPLNERRKLLEKEFREIKNKIKLSELNMITTEDELIDLMQRMLDEKQEGLVLKDSAGVYEPGKRHWLKMKKDYLHDGAMADSADLVVLGAYKGSGRHGGLYSTFLMGTLNTNTSVFCTVCKVHNGLSDQQIEDYTKTLQMEDFDASHCPDWLNVNKSLHPDWVVTNPKKSPIFEVTGFEFSESKVHTATDANGVGFSIRFPRVTKIRNDKKWRDATTLDELRTNIKIARETSVKLRGKKRKQCDALDEDKQPKKKRKIADGRTVCRYDKKCYRKNRDHLKRFRHPQRELKEANEVREKANADIAQIVKMREQMEKAAQIMKEKQLKKNKEECEKKEKEIEAKYKKIMDKALNEYEEKVMPIKQMEQFELEKIEKKFHPDD
eukprot:451356_1